MSTADDLDNRILAAMGFDAQVEEVPPGYVERVEAIRALIVSEEPNYTKVAVRAVDIITNVDRKRLDRARKGQLDSHRVGISWRDLLALADALEAANPGYIDRVYELKEK